MSNNTLLENNLASEQVTEITVIDLSENFDTPLPTKTITRKTKFLYTLLGVILALICVVFSAAWAYSKCLSPMVSELGSPPDYSQFENNLFLRLFIIIFTLFFLFLNH
jgi:uncharacterized protein involved in cysteine biosynthesis